MPFFRSEEMKYCQLLLTLDVAYDCLVKLGEMECVSFKDMSPFVSIHQRRYSRDISRCYNLLHFIGKLKRDLQKANIPSLVLLKPPSVPQPRDIIELESIMEPMKIDMSIIADSLKQLKQTQMELLEMQAVLERNLLSKEKTSRRIVSFFTQYDATYERSLAIDFAYLSGVIPVSKLLQFERMLWRVTWGNLIYKTEHVPIPFEDPKSGAKVYKAVFTIFVQSTLLEEKVLKVCNGFHATLYPYPKDFDDCVKALESVMKKIIEVKYVMKRSLEHQRHILRSVAKCIYAWEYQLLTAVEIYTTMDLFNFDTVAGCLIGECWIATSDVDRVRKELDETSKAINSNIAPPILVEMEPNDGPPTYHRLNKFTKGFQALIDAYGVASYREINPTPYTIVTFPFLFAVMFGDVGHGLVVFLFAVWLVLKEEALKQAKSRNEMWNIVFAGRYIILLMGLFSMYTGLVYNDVFSKSINFFGSSWVAYYDEEKFENDELIQFDPNTVDFIGTPHYFGFDPIWQLAHGNKIIFYNAFKMKVSIILGTLHMLLGISLSLVNSWNFGNYPAIWCEFVPQLIFFSNIFLYLVGLIFYKWIKYDAANSSCAPAILITIINMLMFKSGESNNGCDPYMFPNQERVQLALVYVALICVPWMLLAKPIYIYRERYRQKGLKEAGKNYIEMKKLVNLSEGQEQAEENKTTHQVSFESSEQLEDEDEEAMAEICIHQVILTIEFVLGSVSHTASYLRLWALSLAHSQLTEVMWTMILQKAFGLTSFFTGLLVPFFFFFWAIASVMILIVMEGLSAFLHTLRLHWVEFQSKFYIGQGYVFKPYSIKNAVRDIQVVV